MISSADLPTLEELHDMQYVDSKYVDFGRKYLSIFRGYTQMYSTSGVQISDGEDWEKVFVRLKSEVNLLRVEITERCKEILKIVKKDEKVNFAHVGPEGLMKEVEEKYLGYKNKITLPGFEFRALRKENRVDQVDKEIILLKSKFEIEKAVLRQSISFYGKLSEFNKLDRIFLFMSGWF